ncbi:Spo12 [Phaffia rhodozyma]|uniref:Spo12 n=1 Tax=Phaffia rhodozyma TaxID=264483 RepID=A0A0F7SH41_PHARH|nr:Spo12 [Phaffia rhodozyma]
MPSLTPSSSSASQHIAPLHHPGQEAVVVQPHAPLSNSSAGNNIPPSVKNTITMGSQMGAGQKALLMKRMASNKPSMVSPTDNMMSPCTAKLAGAKKKHFAKGRPMALAQSFSAVADSADDDDENVAPK